MRIAPRDPVLVTLAVIMILACFFTGFITEAPNRLVSGRPLPLWQVTDGSARSVLASLATALLALSWAKARTATTSVLVIAGALFLLLCFAAGHGAAILMAASRPATRIGLGPAFWISILSLAMTIVNALQRMGAGAVARVVVVGILVLTLATLTAAGTFEQLSIMREYASRRDAFANEVLRHGILVFASCAAALAIGVPLGILAARRPGSSSAIFATLNLLQTIPSVALFGLLIFPLSALAAAVPFLATLGVAGIGAAPAITALVLYSLLPIVRNTQAAITEVDRAIIDAADGMGLTQAQIFWRVELPLGLPTLIAGLRIMLVQTIGLAVVAALIGAGGLGTFVFQGIGQYATDLVLLGAIPTILFALAADFILTIFILFLTRGAAS